MSSFISISKTILLYYKDIFTSYGSILLLINNTVKQRVKSPLGLTDNNPENQNFQKLIDTLKNFSDIKSIDPTLAMPSILSCQRQNIRDQLLFIGGWGGNKPLRRPGLSEDLICPSFRDCQLLADMINYLMSAVGLRSFPVRLL
jgi:hypothetical protein